MKEDVSLPNGVGVRRCEVGSVVEVVMVIMTFDGTPTGVSRRLGTGGIIFGSRLSCTEIMVVLNVDVLGMWANLGHGGNHATVVFKDPAVDGGFSAVKMEAQFMKFLDCLHDGDGHAEGHAEANELALGGAECNLGLQLRCPVEWAAGVHDDVAMSGLGSV